MKTTNKSAQSVLEYSAIAMLVIAGILVMGPYMIRSVNAYFKTAEDQAKDSFREEIVQTPLIGREQQYDLGSCQCGFTAFTCSDGTQCPRNQMFSELKCVPSECEDRYEANNLQTLKCSDETTGITFSSAYPQCISSLNYVGCPVKTSASMPTSSLFSLGGYKCCLEAQATERCGTQENGHAGQLLKFMECGPNRDRQYFWEDNDYCSNNCGQKDNRASWCDPVRFNYDVPPSLTGTVKYVNHGECLSDDITCVASCPGNIEGFGASADGQRCQCLDPSTPAVCADNKCHECCIDADCGSAERRCENYLCVDIIVGYWVTTSRPSIIYCPAVCAAEPGGMYSGRNPHTNGMCKSNENSAGNNTTNCRGHIWWSGGYFPPSTNSVSYCYRPGQVKDADGSDEVTACWCQYSSVGAITTINTCY